MKIIIAVVVALALGCALAPSPSAGANGRREGTHAAAIASASGVITVAGQDVIVDVTIVATDAEHGASEAEAALHRRFPAALATRRRGGSTGYTTNGLVWSTLPVVVNYNDTGAPLSGSATDLTAAMATWTDVPTSSFAFVYGVGTSRCPSLVDDCPGVQAFDGHNDVGWLDIADPSILGITWYGTKTQEFDTAIDNRNFTWVTGCTANYSLQSVYLHELGHALGLGHSKDPSSAMYTTYSGPKCSLSADDVQGVSALYPA